MQRYAALAVLSILAGHSGMGAGPILRLTGSIDLPGVSGDVDHMALDARGDRLFLAAEDNGTLRVFDLKSGKLERTVKGFETPHSILYLPATDELWVTDGSKSVRVLDGKTFAVKKTIATTPGADSIGFDAAQGRLFAVTGGKDVSMTTSALSEIDIHSGKLIREIPIAAAHVEAMALEKTGTRLFVNVTDKNYLAVIDRSTGAVAAQWPVREAKQNSPIAFDEASKRLFVVCRDPGKLVVLDSGSGRSIASFDTGARADEAVFDAVHHRVYVAAGEGKLYVYRQIDADHYEALEPVPSAAGAKTALLDPSGRRLFLGVSPGEGKTGARLLIYAVE